MSFNGSGAFTPPGASFPAVTLTVIDSANYNAVINDIATGLSTCITKDGQTVVTANIPLGGFRLTGVGVATARTDAATLASIQDANGVYVATVGGTADVITLTPAPAITAYAAGQKFIFIAGGTNTTNVTVTVNGLSARAITKIGAVALAAGDIQSGMLVEISDDGTRYQLTVPIANSTTISTDASANIGPTNELYRNSSSPAAADFLGAITFPGNSSTAVKRTYAEVSARIVDATNASEDGEVVIRRIVAGTITEGWGFRFGLYTTNSTGGDQGVDTINSKGFYVDGTRVPDVAATQANQETATSTITAVTPGRQQYHPSAAKAWAKWNDAGTTSAAYNVSSVTDNGTGAHAPNYTVSFSSANYAIATTVADVGGPHAMMPVSTATGSTNFTTRNVSSTATDVGSYYAVMFGDQ